MGRRHRRTLGVKQRAGKQISELRSFARARPLDGVGLEFFLYLSPKLLVDNRRMLAGISHPLMNDLAAIDPVLQHLVQRAAREGLPAIGAPIRRATTLADRPLGVERRLQFAHRAEVEVTAENSAHRLGLRLVDDQLPVLDVVAESGLSAHPQALLLRGGDLVADALTRDLA